MLARFLYTPDGKVRHRHMIVVVAVAVAFAIFGSMLLAFTPMLSGHEGVQTLWVLFSVFLLKFPLVGLAWWFIARNKEWPMRPPKWSAEEIEEILAYIRTQGDRVRTLPDAAERLAYLQREAWNVADRVGGEAKVDAVATALYIDSLLAPRSGRRSPAD